MGERVTDHADTIRPEPMEDYPFPLANGQVAILRLPVNLKPEDADRIARYIAALVVQP